MVQKLDDIIVAALKLAKIGFYRYLFDGTIVSIDQATFDFFELEGIFKDPQSLIGQKIESLFIYTGPKRRLRTKIREKGKVVGLEYGFKTLKGKEKWGIHNSYLFIDEETGKEAVQVCFYDITERKRSEEALQESEEKYRAIFENIQDVYYESSLDGVILEVSPSVENISKYKRDELIGKSLYDIYTNPDDRDELIKIILDKGRVSDFEVALTDKDGSQNLCSVSTLLVVDEQGNPIKVVGSMRDITDRKKAEEEKEKIISELQATLAEVKTLRGIIPICSNCKNIRDDEGYWQQVEEYIQNRSDAAFSHGICHECAKKLYPDLDIYDD